MEGICAPPLAGFIESQPAIDVIVTASTGDLSWLNAWKEQLAGAKLLVAHEPSVTVSLPPGFDGAQLVSKGSDAATAKLSPRDLALLASKAPRVLFLTEGCTPAVTPTGETVQLLEEHSTNLSRPATPFFFNTLYDPFRPGTDFVRGYPFSLRDGTKTAVSHGLSLGHPDLDSATLAAKPQASNDRYVDLTLTVPKEAMIIFSPRNLAIDKSLIGIACYSGLDADNTWASFCIKAICNHLGYGCKTGLPYVVSSKPAASPAADSPLAKLQDQVISFFQTLQLSASSTTSVQAYQELASKVKQQLGPVDPYFAQLADGMEAWAKVYTA